MPNLAVDPIVTAAYLITAMQAIVSRNTDPIDSVVVSITSLHGGTLTNVIPDSVTMKGTLRYFKKEKQDFFKNRIEDVVKGICCANNADYIFNFIADKYEKRLKDLQAIFRNMRRQEETYWDYSGFHRNSNLTMACQS